MDCPSCRCGPHGGHILDTKWQERFLALAKDVASWSKDPSTQVGAVIVDAQRRIVGTGYNGFARGVDDNEARLGDREKKYPLTIHAELNAIFNAVKSVKDCTLVCTHFPCAHCASCIAQAGITCVIAPAPSPVYLERWEASVKLAQEVFGEAGVRVEWMHV